MSAQQKRRQSSSPTLRRRLLLSTALTGIVLAAASQPTRAATLTVTNTADTGAGSLRDAITMSTTGDTINVTPGLTGTITLGSDLPPVPGVTIDLSAGSVSIAGANGVSFAGGDSSLNSQPRNTYSGATSLTSGTLTVGGAAGYAATQSQLQVDTGTMFTATTTPTMGTAPGATFASLTGAGTIVLTGGMGNGLDLTGNDQQSTIFSGKITGTGGEFALFGGGGTLTLTGTGNTYSGPTDIFGNVTEGTPGSGPLGATLAAGAANVFSPNSPVVMMGGASSVLNLNNFDQTIGSLAGSGIVQLGSALLTLGGDNTSTTFTGGITGTGGLDKFGTGTFTLTNSGGALQATYSGPTLIDGGVFQAGAAGSFSPNSPVAIAPGATLDLNGFNQTIAGLQGAGSVTLGTGTLTDNQASAATYSGVISGTGGLTKGGAGTLTLSGANTYGGFTTLSAGVLQAGAANAFSPNSQVSIGASGTLALNGFNQTIAGLSGPAGASVTLGSGTLTDNTASSLFFGGVISGNGGLTKSGTGSMILTAAQTYTGATTVNGGTLLLAPNLNGPSGLQISFGSIAASSGLNLAASGAIFDISASGGGTQTIKDLTGVAGSSIVLGGNSLQAGTANSTSFAGVISGGGGIIKQGAGTLTFSGANTYTGATLVNAGTLALATNLTGTVSLGSIQNSSGLNLVSSGATFDISGVSPGATGATATINDLTGVAGSTINLGLTNLTAGTANSTSFAGAINGSGGFTKQGAGTLTMTGVNTYTGATNINGGTLALTGNGSIGSSSGVLLTGQATFDVSGVNSITTIQNLTDRTFGATVNVGSKTLIFGGSSAAPFLGVSFTGTGTGGLIYNGPAAIAFDGNSPGFKGTLLITGGSVAIGDDNFPSTNFGGNVTINGGTLSGHGTIGGTVTNNTGFVQPGGSIGTLTVNGNYTQGANGTLAIEVSPTASSKLAVGGAASLAGTLHLMYDPGVYTTTSYNFLTASSVSGTFGTVVSNTPSGSGQTIVYGPNGVAAQLAVAPSTGGTGTSSTGGTVTSSTGTTVTSVTGVTVTSSTGVTTQAIVVAPTNDTVYTDLTSTLVLNGQRANAIILDRVGNRASGVADGQLALAGAGVTGLQLAQAGTGAVLGDFASALATQGAWFRGLGDFTSIDSHGATPGFTGSSGGFLAGYDRPVAPNVYLGVAGGYLHSIVTERGTGSDGTADTARFAVYGGASLGRSLLTGTAGYAHDWIDTDRPFAGIGTAAESHDGNEATAAGQWSLPLSVQGLGQGVATLTPKVGLQFLHLSEGSFDDSGANGFDLSSSGHDTDSLQPFVAFSVAQKFVTAGGTSITPELRFGYDRETLSGSRTLTVATVGGVQFPVTGIRPSKNIVTAGAGITVDAGPSLALYATYDAIVPTGNTTDQTVEAGLRIRF